MKLTADTLVIGIGNPAREDDGIGWSVIDRLREMGFSGPLEYRYQLNIEDAELMAHHAQTLVVDATEESLPLGFRLERVRPAPAYFFSTHEVSPDTIAYLCGTIFGAFPRLYLLRIQGEHWSLNSELSKGARRNISRALHHLRKNAAQSGFPLTTAAGQSTRQG